jgi:hypothetical protein
MTAMTRLKMKNSSPSLAGRILPLVPDAIDSRIGWVGVEAFCESGRLRPVEIQPVLGQWFAPVMSNTGIISVRSYD